MPRGEGRNGGGRPRAGGLATSSLLCSLHRRRLPVLMVKLRMAQRVSDAVKFVEQARIHHGRVSFDKTMTVASGYNMVTGPLMGPMVRAVMQIKHPFAD